MRQEVLRDAEVVLDELVRRYAQDLAVQLDRGSHLDPVENKQRLATRRGVLGQLRRQGALERPALVPEPHVLRVLPVQLVQRVSDLAGPLQVRDDVAGDRRADRGVPISAVQASGLMQG